MNQFFIAFFLQHIFWQMTIFLQKMIKMPINYDDYDAIYICFGIDEKGWSHFFDYKSANCVTHQTDCVDMFPTDTYSQDCLHNI